MSVGKNTNIQNPYGQGNYVISTSSTEILRKHLLGKNLQSSYLADGNPIPPPFGVQPPGDEVYTNQTMYSVPDQPTVGEVGERPQGKLFLDNKYGPIDGYSDVRTINIEKLLPRLGTEYVSLNSTQPKNFVSSEYTPSEILETVMITNGIVSTLNSKILNDSHLTEISSGWLRESLAEMQKQNPKGLGPAIQGGVKSFNISSSPGKKILPQSDFMTRIGNEYYGYSTIPGNYFQQTFIPDINYLKDNGISYAGMFSNIQATANAFVNLFTGQNDIPSNPNSYQTPPSDTFISYMGEEQQSKLFESFNYNKYRPDYSRVMVGSSVPAVTPYYYVGAKNSEPGSIDGPVGAVPHDEFGRNVGAIVYGPSTLAKELETVDGQALWPYYMFGLQGQSYMDGGSIAGGWTWFGNQSFASLNAPPGLLLTRSFLKPKRKGGILDETQKLIDSAPLMGGARRKHVGHAIDQTSKIFNDGYKDISKGSGARFTDENWLGNTTVGGFCRTWTKDNPYYKMKNLVRAGGNHLKNTSSVLTNTFNLNIAPVMGVNVDASKTSKNVKKYMFSIENLAWRGTSELTDLPATERGPNGGRVMWFPPYDINVGDTTSAHWNGTTFLGRAEPLYTYSHSERIGSLSFKMVVDHPSILNEIAQNTLKGTPDWKAGRVLNSFFAGCRKYDIYELAAKYPNLSLADIVTVQNNLTTLYNSGTEGATQVLNELTPPPPSNAVNSEETSYEDLVNAQPDFQVDGVPYTNTDGSTGMTESFESDSGVEISEDENALNNNTASQSTTKTLDTAKILAKLLGEENYFNELQENNEFVYNSLKRELKHFHPSFHAMTPEGLNSRLSFLLQCTRPGNTIPTETTGGEKNVDAENTAFGAPPICVMRIGDFYHTKIAIDSVSFSYDPLVLDLNPEGIGVQPMIASVQMNFKYIGGQGLEKPVSELQNALSNNFFGNTEMYNNKSVKTGDVGKNSVLPDEEKLILELEANNSNNPL